MQYTERLEALSKKFDEIDAALANSGGTFDQVRFTALMKERSQIEETVLAYRAYKQTLREIADGEELASDRSDPELAALAAEEVRTLIDRRKEQEERLKNQIKKDNNRIELDILN
jgi:peptide chain release factor 1